MTETQSYSNDYKESLNVPESQEFSPSPIEVWRSAPAEIMPYKSGIVRPKDGPAYRYDAGRRLIINNELVMDTCEGPWGQAIVDGAFDHPRIRRLDRSKSLTVLERGAGLNIAGSRIIHQLMGRGSGEYHVIELNDEVADNAEEWKAETERLLKSFEAEHGLKYNIKIQVHRGEAREVTQRLIDEGKKFNIIISDTYPLTKEEKGINDIEDIEVIKKGLYRENGVFGFFSYFPDMELEGASHIATRQMGIVRPHFESVLAGDVDVKPSEGYDYLFRNGEPVRNLPVIICSGKRNTSQ